MHISQINIYPIKSLRGISVESALVEQRGLRYDRRWMLTDREGKFLTQRDFPRLAALVPMIGETGLRVLDESRGAIDIAFEAGTGDVRDVVIWNSVCQGEVYGAEVNAWFSEAIGTNCQLVYMPEETRRGINPRFNNGDDIVSFADGYPVMILGESSLADLNSFLDTPLPMNRFRPNLVIADSHAFDEDNWERVSIGSAEFRTTKPCERCVITTIEQSRGEFDGKEPLRTLATYRLAKQVIPDTYRSLGIGARAVLFGQNLVPELWGTNIFVGDRVSMLENGFPAGMV